MDRKPFRILAIAGSLRQGSYNRGLLRAAQEVVPEWVEVQFFDIGQLPFFNEDVEAAGDPEPVRRLKGAIATSNAVLIATPEYNGAVPGVLANAIDWVSRPTGRSVLRNKSVAIMGAVLGKSGSANAQAVLRGVLGRIGAIVVPDPQVLVPRASGLFDEQVDLRDEGTREEIRQLVEAVANWCRRVQPEEPVSAQSAAISQYSVKAVFKGPLTMGLALLVLILYFLNVNVLILLFGGAALQALLRFLTSHWHKNPPVTSLSVSLLGADLHALGKPLVSLLRAGALAAATPISLGLIFLTFLKLGAVVYGSGYTLLAFLRTDLVQNLNWLTDK